MSEHETSYMQGKSMIGDFLERITEIYSDDPGFCINCYSTGLAIELLAVVAAQRVDHEIFLEVVAREVELQTEIKRGSHEGSPVLPDRRMN